MKFNLFFLIIVFVIGISSCKNTRRAKEFTFEKIENTMQLKSALVLDGNKGIWSFNEKPFNGFAVKYYGNGQKSALIGFYKGKKEGKSTQWFANGRIRKSCYYKNNILVADYTTYWSNGNKAYQVNYNEQGKRSGLESSWWADGKISKKRNLKNGKEDGLQKAWLQNGKLYVNYEAKQGRIFGMRRANSCYNLKNEKVIKYDEYRK